MTLFALVYYAPLLALLIAIAVIDVRQRRIPNALALVVALGGLGQSFWPGAPLGIGMASCGLLAGLLLGALLLAIGAMGGGDVKLLAAVGAWLGPVQILWVFAASAIAAMIVAVGSSMRRGQARALVSNTGVLAADLLTRWRWHGIDDAAANVRELEAREQFRSVGRPLPFAVAVLAGVIAVLLAMPALRRMW